MKRALIPATVVAVLLLWQAAAEGNNIEFSLADRPSDVTDDGGRSADRPSLDLLFFNLSSRENSTQVALTFAAQPLLDLEHSVVSIYFKNSTQDARFSLQLFAENTSEGYYFDGALTTGGGQGPVPFLNGDLRDRMIIFGFNGTSLDQRECLTIQTESRWNPIERRAGRPGSLADFGEFRLDPSCDVEPQNPPSAEVLPKLEPNFPQSSPEDEVPLGPSAIVALPLAAWILGLTRKRI